MTKERKIAQIWKALPIFETYGQESYEKYLFKLIVRMSGEELCEGEREVLQELKGLLENKDIAGHDEIKSVILSCVNKINKM